MVQARPLTRGDVGDIVFVRGDARVAQERRENPPQQHGRYFGVPPRRVTFQIVTNVVVIADNSFENLEDNFLDDFQGEPIHLVLYWDGQEYERILLERSPEIDAILEVARIKFE
jgi:hypothetical protein